MPRYAFEDPESGHQFEMDMTYDEMIKFKEEYPGLDQIFKINFTSSRYGSTEGIKNDDGWNEMLSRIGEAHPDSSLGQTHRKKTNKEIKTADVLAKHRKRQAAQKK